MFSTILLAYHMKNKALYLNVVNAVLLYFYCTILDNLFQCCAVIVACCLLHNYRKKIGLEDDVDEDMAEERDEEGNAQADSEDEGDDGVGVGGAAAANYVDGFATRREIIDEYF